MRVLLLLFVLVFELEAFKIEQSFNIQSIKVEKKSLSNFKTFYGITKVSDENIYDLSLRFNGFVTDIYANFIYKKVKKGEPLFRVYSKEIYNIINELEIAKNNKDLHRSTLKKLQLYDLFIDNIKGDKLEIKSPASGYIFQKNINQGTYLKEGKIAYKIVDLSTLYLIVNVYQKDISFLKEGMRVEAVFDGVDKKYISKVDKIYPNIDPDKKSLPIRVILQNRDEKLYPNMFAEIKIFDKNRTILYLPKNCIIQRDGKHYVFVKSGNEYEPNEVEVQKVVGGYAIKSGLDEGDEVVKNALFLLDSDAVTNGLYSDDW